MSGLLKIMLRLYPHKVTKKSDSRMGVEMDVI